MESLSVDMTYGTALFEASESLGNTKEVERELKELVGILKENDDFFQLLKSPAVSNDEKKRITQKIFGESLSDTLLNFMYVIIDKRRVNQFFGMAKAFDKCLYEKKGITAGTIYSAIDISEDKLKKFEKQTGDLLKKKVELTNKIDKSLIGGVKIYIDGKLIDASIRRRLDDLKEQLV